MLRRIGPLVAIALLIAGCGDSNPLTDPSRPVNAQFVLAPGESTRIEGTAFQLRFRGVVGDSRCPADALCILGGDAIVRIDIVETGQPATSYELHTGSLQPVRHDNMTITLLELAPYPFSSRTIAPDDYRATLRATR